ncbi:MAG: DUF86 domain-containing protein [Coriobacteriia bacterium]|nr:DUF86 domain-containing protein [Coriobacteriia bacterium]
MAYLSKNGVTREGILDDQIVQWTITTPLYNIGENVCHISDAFRGLHPEVPWARIAGMRHRLVHDYEGTNWTIVADTVLQDVPQFLMQIDAILGSQDAN